MNRDKAAHEIRQRISAIEDELDKQHKFRDFAATHDHEYRMSDARSKALRQEKTELKEILGDL